jgi:hypothetical protein
MHSKQTKFRTRGLLRFIAATFAVAFLYISLQATWTRLGAALAQQSWMPGWFTDDLGDEAQQVDEQSAPRESQLTPAHREAAYALGFHLAYAAVVLGPAAASSAAREESRRRLVPEAERARRHAQILGIGDAQPFDVSTPSKYLGLAAAIQADETGLAAQIGSSMTPRHKHLFLMGALVGTAAGQVYVASMFEETPWPAPSLAIAHHATLAGVPPALWEPLVQLDTGRPADEVAKNYHDAAITLSRALAESPR